MNMDQTLLLEVKCKACKNNFNAVMFIGEEKGVSESTFYNEEVECPGCGKTNILAKNNIKIVPFT